MNNQQGRETLEIAEVARQIAKAQHAIAHVMARPEVSDKVDDAARALNRAAALLAEAADIVLLADADPQ